MLAGPGATVPDWAMTLGGVGPDRAGGSALRVGMQGRGGTVMGVAGGSMPTAAGGLGRGLGPGAWGVASCNERREAEANALAAGRVHKEGRQRVGDAGWTGLRGRREDGGRGPRRAAGERVNAGCELIVGRACS